MSSAWFFLPLRKRSTTRWTNGIPIHFYSPSLFCSLRAFSSFSNFRLEVPFLCRRGRKKLRLCLGTHPLTQEYVHQSWPIRCWGNFLILFFPQILRSQKDGKAGKNLKVTGVVHVLLVQVDTNLCSQYSIDITCLAKRYTHYIIFCVRLEVFLPWMAGPVVILIARLSSFLSIPKFLFLSCFSSLFPITTCNP